MANGALPCIMPNRHSLRQVPILRKKKNPTNRDGLYNECLITHAKNVTPSRSTSTKAPPARGAFVALKHHAAGHLMPRKALKVDKQNRLETLATPLSDANRTADPQHPALLSIGPRPPIAVIWCLISQSHASLMALPRLTNHSIGLAEPPSQG